MFANRTSSQTQAPNAAVLRKSANYPNDAKPNKNTSILSFLSGGVAGACAKTAIAPLDRIKIIFQVSKTRKFSFLELGRMIKDILNKEGPLGLWRGNSAAMAKVIPHTAIIFFSFDNYHDIIKKYTGKESLASRFYCGAAAGMTATFFSYPFDLMRARMALFNFKEKSIHKKTFFGLFRTTFSNEGIRGFYKGIRPTLTGYLLYAGTSFATFETCKTYLLEYEKQKIPSSSPKKLRPVLSAACGALASVFAQTVTYPFDIVRRRRQTNTQNDNSYRKRGVLKEIAHIARKEGIRGGVYKGISINFLKGPIAAGIGFTVHDFIKTFSFKK